MIWLGTGCWSFIGCSDAEPREPAPPAAEAAPVYAVMSQVYGVDDGRNVYFQLTDSLDLTELTLTGAREFGGVANYEAIGGRLYISDGEHPKITQFDIGSDHSWQPRAELRFDDYPLFDNANFFYQYLVDEHHMYMPFDGNKRIVWDPTEMAIREVKEDSSLALTQDGLKLEAAGNRGGIRYDGPVMQPFFYHDEDWFVFSEKSYIAVYDPQTHEERKVIEAPCRGLAVASQDEAGNTYFSSFDYGPLRPLHGLGEPACVVRVTKDHELDAAFTQDFTELTGGRYSINFQYIRDGWGLADVLHHEELGSDFEGEIEAELFDKVWDSKYWHVWRIDIANQKARPLEALDVPGLGWSLSRVDGRTFLFVPYDEAARTRVLEINSASEAREHLDLPGDSHWIRVR